VNWANSYLEFLQSCIENLGTDYEKGRGVTNSPELRHIVIKKRSKGDGHIAVYEIDLANARIKVHFIFHTKQDWESRI